MIQMFGLHFVNTGIISRNSGKTYSDIFDRRQKGDYEDFFDFLGIGQKVIEFKNKTINTMKKRTTDFTVDDIPEGKIKENFLKLMKKFGY